MTTVHHPDADYSGPATIGRRTLTFSGGVADLDGPPAAWRRAGYRVSAGDPETVVALEDLTVSELRDYADAHGVDLAGARLKADIVEALASATVEPAPDDDQDA